MDPISPHSSLSSKTTSSLDIQDLLLPVDKINVPISTTATSMPVAPSTTTTSTTKKDFGMCGPDSEYASFLTSSNVPNVTTPTTSILQNQQLNSSNTSNTYSANTVKITNTNNNENDLDDDDDDDDDDNDDQIMMMGIDDSLNNHKKNDYQIKYSREETFISPVKEQEISTPNTVKSTKTPTKIPKSNSNFTPSPRPSSSSRKESKIPPPSTSSSTVMGRKVLVYDTNNASTVDNGHEMKLESPINSKRNIKSILVEQKNEKKNETSSSPTHPKNPRPIVERMKSVTSLESTISSASFKSSSSQATKNQLVSSRNSKQILLKLISSDPLNRSCADCKIPLVDSTNIHTSCYRPNAQDGNDDIDGRRRKSSKPSNDWEFTKLHVIFAPPTSSPKENIQKMENHEEQKKCHFLSDEAIYNMVGGGFGVFVCQRCSTSHLQMSRDFLPSGTLTVKNIMNDAYTRKELSQLRSGGNSHVRTVYEHALFHPSEKNKNNFYNRPSSFLTNSSTLAERQIFCRTKYQALQYLFCPTSVKDKQTNTQKSGGMLELPNRLVDYFCVVSADSKFTLEASVKLENTKSLNDVRLEPTVIDCVSSSTADNLPTHVAKFVFPDGLIPKQQPENASFFSFCLTSESGSRIYGGVLHIYDEGVDLSQILSPHLSSSGDEEFDEKKIPSWLDPTIQNSHSDLKSSASSYYLHNQNSGLNNVNNSFQQSRLSDSVFIPKALIILSHYGFFHVWRQVLQQIYRISLLEAPLPMERYINNFVNEVPLPPQGKVEVQFGGLLENVTISRPAVNRLPIANFSYAPLCSTLSVSNIILIFTYLLQEQRLCLCSEHYPLLTPTCEALLSLLFPFTWQGMYIPITPYNMCMDILEAPVPYLLGVHSRYLTQVSSTLRPRGVIFVDLDRDVVYIDDEVPIPALPESHAAKLRNKLSQVTGDQFYLPTSCGWKGRIFCTDMSSTTGSVGISMPLQNSSREAYCHQVYLGTANPSLEKMSRAERLAQVEKAFGDHDQLNVLDGFATDVGTLLERDVKKEDKWKIRGMKKQKPLSSNPNNQHSNTKIPNKLRRTSIDLPVDLNHHKTKKNANKPTAATMDNSMTTKSQPHLLEMIEADEIRNAFLRFMVALFLKYEKYLDKNRQFLDIDKFVSDQFPEPAVGQCMTMICQTQMMDVFSKESCFPDKPDHVRFFQESIVAKNNRSMKQKWKKGKKEVTPFLVDESHAITETFTPPPPSNWGLPDDGRTYHYSSFPKLKSILYGKTRPPKQWPNATTPTRSKPMLRMTSASSTPQHNQHMFLSQIFDEDEDEEATLNWAIHAMAYSNPLNDNDHPLQTKAQNMISAARRKQGIHLASIVRFQSYARMHLERKKFENLKWAVTVLQRIFQRKPVYRLEKKSLIRPAVLHSVLLIQRTIRTHQRKNSAVVAIQRWFRSVHAKKYWKGLKHSITTVQSLHRRRKAQFVYSFVMITVVKVQGIIRGCMTRKHIQSFIQRRWQQYRKQMFELWKHARAPLVYRSKFWLLINRGSSFLDLALVKNELKRLWEDLGIEPSAPIGNITEVSEIPLNGFGRVLAGLSALTFYQFLQVNTLLEKRSKAKTAINGVMSIFPAELANHEDMAELQAKGVALTRASDRLDSERLQIYDKLTAVHASNPNKVKEIYQLFRLTEQDKLKKQRFVTQLLWESYEDALSSAKALLSLFPELVDSTNINYNKPSKKGRKLFHVSKSNVFLAPLLNTMNVETKIDQLIIQDLREVGLSFLSSNTNLSNRSIQSAKAAPQKTRRQIVCDFSSNQYNAIFYPNELCQTKKIPLPQAQKIMHYVVVHKYLFG